MTTGSVVRLVQVNLVLAVLVQQLKAGNRLSIWFRAIREGRVGMRTHVAPKPAQPEPTTATFMVSKTSKGRK